MSTLKYGDVTVNYTFDKMMDDLNRLHERNAKSATEMQNLVMYGLPSGPVEPHPTNSPDELDEYMKLIDKSKLGSTTKDAANEDTYELILQQNSMYIVGSLACASLIVGAIFMSKE